MKAKFQMGFLTGFKNVENAWPGSRHVEPILEPMKAMAGDMESMPDATPLKHLVFECRRIDDDRAAVFELLEIR